MAAQNVVRQAEAAGDDGDSQWGMFHIILRETGEVIGDIGFHGPPDETGTVEIGYGIVEQYRGRGLAGEATVAICGLAWSRPEVTRIIARTDEDNAASGGVLRHAGFREDRVANGMRNFSLERPLTGEHGAQGAAADAEQLRVVRAVRDVTNREG